MIDLTEANTDQVGKRTLIDVKTIVSMVIFRANLKRMALQVSLSQRTKDAPEIAELHFASGENEDILWFHIYSIERTSIDARKRESLTAMKHSMRVKVVECRDQLTGDLLHLKGRRKCYTMITS